MYNNGLTACTTACLLHAQQWADCMYHKMILVHCLPSTPVQAGSSSSKHFKKLQLQHFVTNSCN